MYQLVGFFQYLQGGFIAISNIIALYYFLEKRYQRLQQLNNLLRKFFILQKNPVFMRVLGEYLVYFTFFEALTLRNVLN